MNIIETNLNFTNLSTRNKTTRIILHHTAVAVEQSVETIHNYHKNSLGYAGIGYHFYVRKNGEIYRGRPENTVGAHAYGANTDSIGICFEGNFEEETMAEVQMKAGQELVAYLKQKYGISTVKRHKDVCNTSCPGANFPFDTIVSGSITEAEPQYPYDRVQVIKNLQTALNNSYDCGLAVDGIVGPATTEHLTRHPAKIGNSNELVRWVQDRLVNHKGYSVGNSGIDGIFGTDTQRAVRDFQRDNNLTIDGIAGIDTNSILI